MASVSNQDLGALIDCLRGEERHELQKFQGDELERQLHLKAQQLFDHASALFNSIEGRTPSCDLGVMEIFCEEAEVLACNEEKNPAIIARALSIKTVNAQALADRILLTHEQEELGELCFFAKKYEESYKNSKEQEAIVVQARGLIGSAKALKKRSKEVNKYKIQTDAIIQKLLNTESLIEQRIKDPHPRKGKGKEEPWSRTLPDETGGKRVSFAPQPLSWRNPLPVQSSNNAASSNSPAAPQAEKRLPAPQPLSWRNPLPVQSSSNAASSSSPAAPQAEKRLPAPQREVGDGKGMEIALKILKIAGVALLGLVGVALGLAIAAVGAMALLFPIITLQGAALVAAGLALSILSIAGAAAAAIYV